MLGPTRGALKRSMQHVKYVRMTESQTETHGMAWRSMHDGMWSMHDGVERATVQRATVQRATVQRAQMVRMPMERAPKERAPTDERASGRGVNDAEGRASCSRGERQ